jgi:hypothetical protein
VLINKGGEKCQQKILKSEPFLPCTTLSSNFRIAMARGAGALDSFVRNLFLNLATVE